MYYITVQCESAPHKLDTFSCYKHSFKIQTLDNSHYSVYNVYLTTENESATTQTSHGYVKASCQLA